MMVTCDNTESSDLSSRMSQQNNIPSFSDISLPHKRSHTSHQFYRPLSDKSFWPDRAQSAFQPSCIGSIEDQRSISSLKLPPITSPPKETSMPPQIANEVPFDMSSQNPYPFSDLKTAYESMMIGYFMPAKVHNSASYQHQLNHCSDDCCSNEREFESKVNPSTAENKRYYTASDVYVSNSVISKNTTHHTRKSTLQRSKRISHSDGSFMNHFVPSTDCCTLEDKCSVETNDSASTFSSRELKAVHDSCSEKKHFDYPTPIRRASNDFSSWMDPTWDVEPSSSQPLFASTFNKTTSSTSNDPQKSENNLGRFSVLPPVASSTTPGYTDGDNLSWLSYSSGNAQTGTCYASFNPFCGIIPDSSPLNCSPRHSGRSSYSNRSRNKRALSNSPLSADGIDLNTLIRMSPTSLVAYINGSRSSSSCVSSGGEKAGSYGHLSARNSSSSPYSGSNSSSNRRSCSYTPQTGTPVNSCSHIFNENSTNCPSEKTKEDLESLHDSLLVMQAIQELESGINYIPNADTIIGPSLTQQQPEFDNLQVLPQDLAFFSTEDYVLPAVHTYLPSPTLSKPPPTYDQHMARKAILQKHSSSDSSQPSNSSSFESSEGDKTGSTDTESNRMYACRWLECSAVFHDQDEFVTHIEKVHIDSKKGDDFVCFWKLCPRRLHPFNARYKLLVHMRIHSGDKPNKCTFQGCNKAFSRLENLKIHLRSHTGERPYSCTFPACTKTFSNSSDRTKHQKTHHDTKPYVCQIVGCGKRYTDPSSLRKHVKKSHPQNKEPDRKKIKGGLEDPKDLTDCLVIQPLRLMDASPTDSSQPSSDAGLLYMTDSTSPSSHNSSPRNQHDCENLSANNNHLRVPILPPLPQTFKSSPQTAKTRSSSNVFPSMKKPSSVLSYSNMIYNSPSPAIRKHE